MIWSTVARYVCDGITVIIYGVLVLIGMHATQPLFLPYARCSSTTLQLCCRMHQSHSVVVTRYLRAKTVRKRKLTASQGSRTVVIVVVRMLVFVLFCKLNAERCRLHPVCPGCVAIPYLVRLRFAVRGPSKGGFMVWPSGQSPCEAKNLRSVHLLSTCSTSFSRSWSVRTLAKKFVGQVYGSAV